MTVIVILNIIFRRYQNEKKRIVTQLQVSEGLFLMSLKNSHWQEYSP